jgi:hypothetical protein
MNQLSLPQTLRSVCSFAVADETPQQRAIAIVTRANRQKPNRAMASAFEPCSESLPARSQNSTRAANFPHPRRSRKINGCRQIGVTLRYRLIDNHKT